MKLRTGQSGMTLIEILIAVSITALVMTIIGSVVFQFNQTTEKGNDQYAAGHDIQNAGHWISIDGKMANTTNLIDDAAPVSSMSLMWSDGGANHTSTYNLSGTDLIRTFDGSNTTVAHNITSVGFSVSQRLITANITSEPSGRWDISEQAVYRVFQRPTG